MLLAIIFFTLGLAALIKGAGWLVDGASSVSLKLKIQPIVIGLTVVAFGTSAPELLVSATSALSGNTDIALGNIIGSNIANILLILGLSAMIFPLTVQKNTVWKEIPMSFLAAFILTILGLQEIIDRGIVSSLLTGNQAVIGHITLSNGLVLLSFFIIFMYYTFGIAKASGEIESEIKSLPIPKSIAFISLGLIALSLGSKLTVDNAISIARGIGVSDNFIGLTLVALGTSLPELVTSVVAAFKKNADIAVGNVVGSNIFNIFFVLGITSLLRPIPLREENLTDILMLFATTILLFLSLFVLKKHTIGKLEGSLMVILYTLYIAFLVIRG